MDNAEDKVADLTEQNKSLEAENDDLKRDNAKLKRDVEQLEGKHLVITQSINTFFWADLKLKF